MSSATLPANLVELFESGVSILVGTRNAERVPETTYGAGALVHSDRTTLTVYLPEATAERTLANIEDNQQIAVAFSSVLDHKTIQVKGTVSDVRPANDGDREIVSRYHVAYTEVLHFVGYPRAVLRSLNVWPSRAITFAVSDVFQQTPGPGAGERVKAGA